MNLAQMYWVEHGLEKVAEALSQMYGKDITTLELLQNVKHLFNDVDFDRIARYVAED